MISNHHKLLLLLLLLFYQCNLDVVMQKFNELNDFSIEQVVDDADDYLPLYDAIEPTLIGFNFDQEPNYFDIQPQNVFSTSIRAPPQLLI